MGVCHRGDVEHCAGGCCWCLLNCSRQQCACRLSSAPGIAEKRACNTHKHTCTTHLSYSRSCASHMPLCSHSSASSCFSLRASSYTPTAARCLPSRNRLRATCVAVGCVQGIRSQGVVAAVSWRPNMWSAVWAVSCCMCLRVQRGTHERPQPHLLQIVKLVWVEGSGLLKELQGLLN